MLQEKNEMRKRRKNTWWKIYLPKYLIFKHC